MERDAPDAKRHSTWALIAVLVITAIAAACADEGAPNKAHGRGVYVPVSWSVARTMPGHELHVAKEHVACTECHALGESTLGDVTPQACKKCHEQESEIDHALDEARAEHGAGSPADCMQCHAFVPKQGGTEPVELWDCLRCHARAHGDTPAVIVHSEGECKSCHQPHAKPPATPADCTQCHDAIATEHANQGKNRTQVCTTCHQNQHARAGEARVACAECHAKERPIVPATATFPEGHTECIGCHRSHEFEREKAAPCRECHEDVRVLAAATAGPHNDCKSCHRPHDVRADPSGACLNCHKDARADHPAAGKISPCTTCHDPHPHSAKAPLARACSSCHHAAENDHAFHAKTSECTDCHKPHHFALGEHEQTACADCHAGPTARASALEGHAKCAGCHTGLPHEPAVRRAECSSCHQPVAAQTIKEHSACTQCHEPHSGAQEQPCSSCHKNEHATAPAGHKQCTQCHQPHTGAVGKQCASCHQDEAASHHGKVRGGCDSCHRPHGPEGVAKPPACSNCHAPSLLPGLHTERQHAQCNRCHTAHDNAVIATRATCLDCHRDMTKHFPESPQCTGCHLFSQEAPKR